MAVEAPETTGLPHAVFLSRIGDEPRTESHVRLAQGAFLAMRLVDLLAPGQRVQPDVFTYQWTATERYCAQLSFDGPEGAHLQEIVNSVGQAYRVGKKQLLVPALFAYAYHLERELRLEEALDVVETLLRVVASALDTKDAVRVHLRLGLLYRSQARFDEADAAYSRAEELATTIGDRNSVLLGRIGRVIALVRRGNLADSEQQVRGILAEARAAQMRDLEARGEHILGEILVKRGTAPDGAPHLWRAYELYDDVDSKVRALGDLGITLEKLGAISSAERALQQVVRIGRQQEVLLNARVELMHCASYRRDRIGFERWLSECERHVRHMTPSMLADFLLKSAIGYARFGQFRKARRLFEDAHNCAASHKLHELEFRIERIKAGLGDCEEVAREGLQATAEPVLQHPELREVAASLELLGV